MTTVPRRALRVPVVELLRRPGNRRHLGLEVPVGGLAVVDSHVAEGEPVTVELELEALTDGVVVTGTLTVAWEATCRRCLRPVRGAATAVVREVFAEHPVSDEQWVFDGEELDLEPMVRELLLLELPLAPLCRETCAGLCPTCGADRNEGPCGCDDRPVDPRWQVLDALRARPGADEPPANGADQGGMDRSGPSR